MNKHVGTICCVVLLLITGMTTSSWGGDGDWRIFDIKGKVVLFPAHGESKQIANDQYLLAPLEIGDRLLVDAKGKIVVVSRSTRQSFELAGSSEAVVESGKLRVVKGEVIIKEGFAIPRSNEGRIGGTVMRGLKENVRNCIKALSPVDTSVIDAALVFKWENTCGLKDVDVTLVTGDKIIFSTTTSGNELSLPPDTLKPGNRYMWLIDGGGNYNMSSGAFNTLPAVESKGIQDYIATHKGADDDIAAKVAMVFYLDDKGLRDLAMRESDAIRQRFPAAAGLDLLP